MKNKHSIFSIFCLIIALLSLVCCDSYEKELPPPKIFFNIPDSLVEATIGDTIYLSPKITYDIESQYKWYINKEWLTDEREIMHVSEKLGEIIYDFTVITPNGTDSITLIVRTIELIDFNNFPLEDKTFDIGENLHDAEGFRFGNLLLPNNVLPEKQWEGFAMSYYYDTNIFPYDTIYSVYGTNSSKNRVFTILSLSNTSKLNSFTFAKDSSYLVGSIDVCNSTHVYNMIVFGNGEEIEHFGRQYGGYPGDSLIVRFNGYDNVGNYKGFVDFCLADYRFEKNSDVYQIKDFTAVDLSSLGFVNNIVIEMFSSMNDLIGNMLIPPFVCFDNIKIFDKIKN